MEQHVLDLCVGMVARGHNVHVWCPEGPMVPRYSSSGAKVTVTKLKLECDLKYIFNLVKFLRANRIDVLHAHEIKAVANSMFAGFIAGTRVRISHTHTPISEWQISDIKKWVNMLIQFFVVSWFSTKEIALTQSRRQAKRKEGLSAKKLEIIPNGIDVEYFAFTANEKANFRAEIFSRYGLPEDSFVFGTVGRLSAEKGHDLLVKAIHPILLSDQKSYLLLAGGGPLENEVRAQLTNYGLEKQIIITGRFSNEDHKKFFCAIDCFIHPSLAEGFGITLVEAMAARIPVIASDLDVFKEVGGDTVTYFQKGNSADLTQKINDALTAKDQLNIKADAAYQRVIANYSMAEFITRYEKLYLDLLK